MWQIVLIGSGLATALLGVTAIDLASPADGAASAARLAEATDRTTQALQRIERGPDGLFYVEVSTASGEAELLVDTGASHVVLSHGDAKRLGAHRPQGEESAIATAAGTIKADWVVIDSLEVNGHVLTGVKAAVPHDDVKTSLLGQNVLAEFGSIRIDGDYMTIER